VEEDNQDAPSEAMERQGCHPFYVDAIEGAYLGKVIMNF